MVRRVWEEGVSVKGVWVTVTCMCVRGIGDMRMRVCRGA